VVFAPTIKRGSLVAVGGRERIRRSRHPLLALSNAGPDGLCVVVQQPQYEAVSKMMCLTHFPNYSQDKEKAEFSEIPLYQAIFKAIV